MHNIREWSTKYAHICRNRVPDTWLNIMSVTFYNIQRRCIKCHYEWSYFNYNTYVSCLLSITPSYAASFIAHIYDPDMPIVCIIFVVYTEMMKSDTMRKIKDLISWVRQVHLCVLDIRARPPGLLPPFCSVSQVWWNTKVLPALILWISDFVSL